MSLLAKAGTITVPASGSSAITGLGGSARFILFLTASGAVSGAWVANENVGVGFWGYKVGTSPVRSMHAVNLRSTNAGASSSTVRSEQSVPIKNDTWGTGGSVTEGADGFTLNYGSPRPATGTLIHYIAFAGDASISASKASGVLPTGRVVGATYTQPVSAVGAGRLLLLIGVMPYSLTAKAGFCFGVVDQALNQWSISAQSETGQNPTDTSRRLDSAHALHGIDDAGNKIWDMRVTGMTATSFSYQHDVVPTTNNQGIFAALMVSGNLFSKAGTLTKPTGAAPQTADIATSFAPNSVILATDADTALDTATTQDRGSIGVSDLTNHAAIAWQDADAVTPANAHGVSRTDAAVIKANNTTSTEEARATASLIGTGARLTFTPNDAVATQVAYLVLGGAAFTFDAIISGESDLTLDYLRNPVYLMPQAIQGSSFLPPIDFGETAFLDATIAGDSGLSASLALTANLAATIAGDSLLVMPRITKNINFAATIAGDALLSLDMLRNERDLGSVVMAGDSAVTFRNLVMTRPLSAVLVGGSDLVGYFRYILPVLRKATSTEYPGTVNLALNPGFEDGATINWLPQGAATLVEELGIVWEGARSAKITMPGTAAGEGLAVRSVFGTELTGVSETTGIERYLIGSLMYRSAPANMEVWSRAVYTDGSTVESERAALDVFAGSSYLRAVAPPLILDPAKKLQYAEVLLTTTVAQAGTWYADGAQIEEDRGEGVTPWVSGALGLAVGHWQGTANKTVSIRDPLPLILRASSRGGVVIIESKMFRATWDGRILEDISDAFTDAVVTMDPDRDVTWAMDARMTWRGYRELQPVLDWVIPQLTVTHPDGSVHQGPLGLYMTVPSDISRREYDADVSLSAYDPLWLLSLQAFATLPTGAVGTSRTALVRQILGGATFAGDGSANDPRRYSVPTGGPTFVEAEDWNADDSRLSVANDILEGGGFYPLATNARGIISTRDRTSEQLKDRQPVRTIVGNVPEGTTLDARIPSGASLQSEIVGVVKTVPAASAFNDTIVLVNDNPRRPPSAVSGRWTRPYRQPGQVEQDVALSYGQAALDWLLSRYPRPVTIPVPGNPDPATLPGIARGLADALSARTQVLTIGVLPNPAIDYLRETVLLAAWDARGDPVAVGQFVVLSSRWGFTPRSCIQTMELGYVDAAGTRIVTTVVQ